MVHFKEKARYNYDDLLEIIRVLRSPEGCPWDQVQTHQSIRRGLLEEAYEAAEGIDRDDADLLREELGDVLMQVVFHADIERQRGRFTMEDVVDGVVKKVSHQDGNFHKAFLPKASTENERSTVVIETPEGIEVMARQIAGAVARRIVTYASEGEECYIDEHMGFIKFGSRVDVYLPVGSELCVKMGQKTVGNQTVLARLK